MRTMSARATPLPLPLVGSIAQLVGNAGRRSMTLAPSTVEPARMEAWVMSVRGLALMLSWGLAVAIAGCTVNNTSSGTSNDGGTDGGSSTCSTDTTVTCTQGTGWSCTGSDSPEESNPLVCSVGTAATGKTEYCCVTWTTVSTCMEDAMVTGCQEGTGFSCTGSDTPDQSDTSLVCSSGTADTGKTDYCCVPYDQSTCMQDTTVMCTSGSIGFSCTGSDTPSQGDSSLTSCSTPTMSNGMSLYCCY
jgi:hypothetical protein